MLVRNSALLASELFQDLSKDGAAALLAIIEIRTFSPNEKICSETDGAKHVFVVLNGLVRMTRSESGGREADIGLADPGDLIGEYLIPGGRHYLQAAYAAVFTELAMIDLSQLRVLMGQRPELQRNVMRIMARHLITAMDCIAADRLHTAVQRVANYLLKQCPSNMSGISFRLPYQKRVIAGKLGLAPEALSRAFAALAGYGVGVQGRMVRVHNVSLLREAC